MSKEETIGSVLRKARLKKGITLEDAYKALKIQPKILDLLEKDSITQTMHKIYVQSFVKKYAKYLNVDVGKFVPGPSIAPLPTRQDRGGKAGIALSPKKRWRQYLLISAAVIVFIAALSLIVPAPPQTPVAAANKPAPVVKKQEPQTAKPSISIPKNEVLSLRIETKDNVWMRVKSDGKVVFEHTLKKASTETWSAKKELELWVGKAEALNLSLNGTPLPSPGSGRIKRIVINHSGLTVAER